MKYRYRYSEYIKHCIFNASKIMLNGRFCETRHANRGHVNMNKYIINSKGIAQDRNLKKEIKTIKVKIARIVLYQKNLVLAIPKVLC